tara:strand:- start:472 stop:798 length:327 start_codon:yes stop_codon:yes gene_type:complete
MNNYNQICVQQDIIQNQDDEKIFIKNYIRNKKERTIIDFQTKRNQIIKDKMIKWLLTDIDKNMIILDILKESFNMILKIKHIKLNHYKYKLFFTLYCNWIYRNTISHD